MMNAYPDVDVPGLDNADKSEEYEYAIQRARKDYGVASDDDDDDDDGHPDPDGEGDDGRGTNQATTEPDDEVEPVPAWIRYMPKKLQQQPKVDDTVVSANEVLVNMQLESLAPPPVPAAPVLVPIKPSSNRFGPTSLKARSQKRSRTGTSSAPYAQDEQRSSSQRMKDKLNRCNVIEAEMLFSMTGIAKK